MVFLCMGSEAVPCWCWKRRRCWQGRALRELCCGRSSHGGSLADHLCCIIWAQPAEKASSACFCMGSCAVSIKWDCGCMKKCSLFLHPLTNPKLSVKPLAEPKKEWPHYSHLESQKSVWIASFGHGTMKTRPYLLENMLPRDGEGYASFCLSH